jgi:2'-5' RNA ligase
MDTLHLTLAFVGDVDEDELPALCAIAETARAGLQPPHSLLLDRLGYWPQKRILWATSAQPPPALEALAGRLAGGLREAGHRLPLRPFAPHVTLLRKAGALPPAPASDVLQDMPQPWHFDRFCLLRSRLSANGAAYETLAAWPL